MRIFPILFLALASVFAQAQNLRSYDISSGLSENTVKHIIQDKSGYIWLGTQDGLNKFNGHEFVRFGCSYQQTNGVGNLNILNMKLHRDGVHIWVATKEIVLLFDSLEEQFDTIPLPRSVSPSCFEYDSQGNLLLGSSDGIFELNESEHRFREVSIPEQMKNNRVYSLFRDSKGCLWACCENGLYRSRTGIYDRFELISKKRSVSIAEDNHDNIWIGFWYDGLAKFDPITKSAVAIPIDYDYSVPEPLRVRNILCTSKGSLLLSTNHGLYDFHPDSKVIKHIYLKTNRANDDVYNCFIDRENGLWIGTYFKGLFYISPNKGQIECYTPDNSSTYFHGSAISSFCEENESRTWIGSENGGLSIFNPIEQKFLKLPFENPAGNIHSLVINKGFLYVGTFAQGLIKINLNTGEQKSFTTDDGLPNNHVYCLKNSSSGKIYVGTQKGCSLYDPVSGSLSIIEELAAAHVFDICEDGQNNVWFADGINGLHKYDRSLGVWSLYSSENSNLPNNKLIGLWLDGDSGIYICSDGGGVSKYDYSTDRISPFRLFCDGKEKNLSVIYGIRKDYRGRLWLSSNDGLYCCDENGIAEKFSDTDNLQSKQFNYGAIYSSESGKIYFGGINGFNIINAEQSLSSTSVAPTVTAAVFLTDSTNSLNDVHYSENNTTVVIPRSTRSFSLCFECLSYLSPASNKYYYRIDNNSSFLSTSQSSVSFVNFPYGKHQIEVYATNAKGEESINRVTLTINNQPPFHLSLIAKILYIVLLLVVSCLIVRWTQKKKEYQSKYNAFQAKMDFFTQIAHEIKTPVTLIKAPLEMIMKNKHEAAEQKNLETIENNTSRLLNLIGQLLDFKKISAEGYRICTQINNPVDVVRSVTGRFNGGASEDIDIRMTVKGTISPCLMDAEAYVKIVSNLMSNALKHTRTFIDVAIEVKESPSGQSLLHLTVSDDGDGIPESESEAIFSSFYQIGRTPSARMDGVGLGLPLVRLLAEKHGGTVYLNNSYRPGCQMCVDIPYYEKSLTEEDLYEKKDLSNSKKRILVVEDNVEMLEFICSSIEGLYYPIKAKNGREALSLLNDSDVELIVTDISMPEMDGYELLKAVRSDEAISFLPVILLTAESSVDAKIKCLEYGCNAFIEKPFSVEQLKATINNLISERDRMRTNYLAPVPVKNLSSINPSDLEFIERITSIVRAKIGDSEIPVDELAEYMNMSRSSLQRKIKGLTGITPIEFMRKIKLDKAAELLKEGRYRINEVCYMVGINKPSTFAAYFKEQFGVLPKDFINTNN